MSNIETARLLILSRSRPDSMIEQDVSARLNPAIIELQREVLNSGHPLRIKLYGMSMYPLIRPGDVTVIRPVRWTDLRRGDVVFYERESRLVAHRVLVPPFDDESPLIAKGDTLENFDPPVRPDQLMGRVEALERGGRTLSLTQGWRGRAQVLAAEMSGPYSALFWKVAALRRRMLKRLLDVPAYRRRRRASGPDGVTRAYLLADADHLANCLWDLRPGLNFAQMRDWTSNAIERMGAEGASVCVLEESRRLVGAAAVLPPDPEGRVWVTDWYVHPLARGFGFGEALLDAAEDRAAASGATEMRLGVPASARAARTLLRKRGWKSLGIKVATTAPRLMPEANEPVAVWMHAVRSSALPAESVAEQVRA